jgi:hypothetical protein
MSARITATLASGLLAFAPVCFAQYTLDLTGVGNGTVADGVYVSPYQGTIYQGSVLTYAGYMICDDFNTESYLNQPWIASMTDAGNLNGTEKFQSNVTFMGNTYTAAQAYDAAAWLANGLVPGGINNPISQVNYSFAIWNIFDGRSTDPEGGALALEMAAFAAAAKGYVANNVDVYTPTGANPLGVNQSQEFLVVHAAPEIDPASATGGLTLLLGGLAVLRSRGAQKQGRHG